MIDLRHRVLTASKRLENVHQGGRQRWSTPINLTLIVTLNLVVCSVCCGEAKTGTEKNELDSAKRGVLRYDETITGVSFPGLPCQNTLASSDWSGNRTFDDNTCEQQRSSARRILLRDIPTALAMETEDVTNDFSRGR